MAHGQRWAATVQDFAEDVGYPVSNQQPQRESIWSVELKFRDLYFYCFGAQVIIGGIVVGTSAEVQATVGIPEKLLALWASMAPIVVVSAGTSVLLTELVRIIMGLAGWVERKVREADERIERRREEQRAMGRAMGRAEVFEALKARGVLDPSETLEELLETRIPRAVWAVLTFELWQQDTGLWLGKCKELPLVSVEHKTKDGAYNDMVRLTAQHLNADQEQAYASRLRLVDSGVSTSDSSPVGLPVRYAVNGKEIVHQAIQFDAPLRVRAR